MEKKQLIYPKISVVTICFNAQEDLLKTIDSVKSLEYSNLEYIIVDGGSSDNTKSIIAQHQQFVSKWVSEPDNGIYDAMNKGILMCTGEWVIFMNAGDVFHSKIVLNEVFSTSFKDRIGVIYGDVNLIFPKIGTIRKTFKGIKSSNVPLEICHQGVFTKTDLLKKSLYNTGFKIMADLNSFIEIYSNNFTFYYVPQIIADFDIVGGVSSTKPFLSHIEMMRLKKLSPLNVGWYLSLFHAIFKWLCLKLLPQSIYNKFRYNKLLNMNGYEKVS